MRALFGLVLIFAFACSSRAQSTPQSRIPDNAAAQQPDSTTYSDTLRLIKVWLDTEETDDMARLFKIGDLRTSDLVAVCDNTDDEIAFAAFLTLQLLGKPECVPCGESVSTKQKDVPFVCGAKLADVDFTRIERWLAKRKNRNGYECAPEGEYEPLTPLQD